jgi:hypothetical protein
VIPVIVSRVLCKNPFFFKKKFGVTSLLLLVVFSRVDRKERRKHAPPQSHRWTGTIVEIACFVTGSRFAFQVAVLTRASGEPYWASILSTVLERLVYKRNKLYSIMR